MEMPLPSAAIDFVLSEDGMLIREDIAAWTNWQRKQEWFRGCWHGDKEETLSNLEYNFNKLFVVFPEFRSIYDYRTSKHSVKISGVLPQMVRRTELHIQCSDIGPRFLIEHGHSTIIYAQKIGSDFKIGQNITIGANGGVPQIGHRVTIRTGSVVVGPITIGDDCIVTINAVVTEPMPAGYAAYAPRTTYKLRKSLA